MAYGDLETSQSANLIHALAHELHACVGVCESNALVRVLHTSDCDSRPTYVMSVVNVSG